MSIRQSSVDSFYQGLNDGTLQRVSEKLTKAIEVFGPRTRRELRHITGIEYSTVSGTITKLIQQEELEEVGVKYCEETRKTVAILDLKKDNCIQKSWGF